MALIILFILLCCFFAQTAAAGESIKINIAGITGAALKNTQDHLTIEETLYGKNLSVTDIQDFFDRAPDTIRQAIEPYGYFKIEIHSVLLKQAAGWIAGFQVQLGPPLRIARLDLQIEGPGQYDPELQKLINHFPVKTGDVFLTEKYEEAKSALFQTANDQGYLKALLVKKEIQINLHRNTAIVILHLNTGPQYYFGPVTFSKGPLASSFLQRFVPFQPGETFSSPKVLKFQQDLTNSRYFHDVSVVPQFNKAQDFKVPTQVQLQMRKAKQYKWGVGYGTFTGPRVLFGVDWRRIGDQGHHFTALAKWSTVLRGLAAKYFIPGKNPLTDQYTFGANLQQFIPQNGRSFSESLNAGYIKMLGEWQHSVSLNLLNERYTFNGQPHRNSHELYPAYNISHISADNIVDTHSGRMINFTLQGSSEKVFSTTSFIQSELKAKYIFSPTARSRVILRGDLGYTVVNNINQLPLTLQYLAGGPGSVRGYNYGSIGPGRYVEVASAEYQHHVVGDIYGAVFYDIGTATNQFNTGFKRGDGVGLVYLSPVGPIQVYVARAESKSWKPKSIIFNIGPEF